MGAVLVAYAVITLRNTAQTAEENRAAVQEVTTASEEMNAVSVVFMLQ